MKYSVARLLEHRPEVRLCATRLAGEQLGDGRPSGRRSCTALAVASVRRVLRDNDLEPTSYLRGADRTARSRAGRGSASGCRS